MLRVKRPRRIAGLAGLRNLMFPFPPTCPYGDICNEGPPLEGTPSRLVQNL